MGAPVFAALGDATRLALIHRLAGGEPLSIARLSQGLSITRQAVTKHLGALRSAGLVRRERRGREALYRLDVRAIDDARQSLDTISQQWDEALERLRRHVEG